MKLYCNKIALLAALFSWVCACGATRISISKLTEAGQTSATVFGVNTAEAVHCVQNPSLCLDVMDKNQAPGTGLQVWTCDQGSNQLFHIDAQGLIHVFSNMCLQAKSLNDQVVLATCSADDTLQIWHTTDKYRVATSNGQCLSINSNGILIAGTQVVTTACNFADAAQTWMASPAATSNDEVSDGEDNTNSTTSVAAAAQVLTTQTAASMASLAQKAPAPLAAQINHIEAAALTFNLQPQLLVAIAMVESTGGSDLSAYSNGGGMFQFTSEETWKKYGTNNLVDRQNDALSVIATAKYMASLLNNHGGNLSAALREYNGAVADGGDPSYISNIFAIMNGNM